MFATRWVFTATCSEAAFSSDDRAPFGCRGLGNKFVQFFSRHAGELRFLVCVKNMDAVFHDHFEKRHCEPRNFVCDAHSRILINHGRFGDTWCVKKVGSDELISSLPEEGSKFLRLTLVKRPALANKNLSGLAHCKVDYL